MADYSIVGDTRLDASGFNKGLSTMSVAAGELISGMVKTATGKISELVTSSVGIGMSFQSSMSQVAATMGTSVDQIETLTAKAKEMGSTTAFTATQAADALNYLALAGYDADKAAEVLPSVLNLAAAGGMNLAYASDLVTDAMASLNLEASKQNVDEFGNKLAMAASKANANVSQLGEAILTVGGTASNLKEGTTELTTALGLLANVGIKGAEGGTHLRNIILSLQSPTKDAKEVMSELGLEVYDAEGKMRGLDDILTDLNTAMSGMTQGQKDSVINQLFNKTDLAAVNGLLAAQGEQWETLADQIDAAGEASGDTGAMAQMAETQLDNLQGAVTIMQSAMEGLQLGIYDYLEPALTDAAQWGADCFSALTNALTENGPEGMLQAAGEIISDLAAAVAGQLPELAATGVTIIAQLAEDIVAATPQMLAVAASILGALVDSLSTALPQLVDVGIEMISQLGTGLKDGLPELLANALPIIADFASGLRENAGQLVDAGIELILNLMQGLMDGLPTLIEYLPGIISDIAGVINDNLPKILNAGIELILILGKGLLQAVPTLVANIPEICKAIFDVFTAFRWVDIGSQIINGLWKGLTSGWTGLVTKVGELAQQLPDIVKRVLGIHSPSKVFDEIGMQTCAGLAQGLTRGNQKVKDAAKTVVASVTDTATQISDGVTTVTETITETMANGATQQKQVITETSKQLVNGVEKTVKTVTTRAADGSETITQTLEDIKAAVVSTTKDTQTALADGAKVTVEKTTELLADGSEKVSTVTTRTGKEIIDGVERTVKTVTTKTADGVETTVRTIEDAGVQYASAGELLTTQLRDKLNDGWDAIQEDIQTDALGAIESLATALKNGDLEKLGLWAASYFWHACTAEQQAQIQSLAMGALNQLSAALNSVGNDLASLAMSLVAKFVPAAASATAGQTALNIAMDANPIGLIISLIGLLVGALINFAGTNESVANGFKKVWYGVEDVLSVIFESILRVLGLGVQGFVDAVNAVIDTYNWVADKLGLDTISRVSNPLWDAADKIADQRKQRQEERNNSSSSSADSSSDSSSTPSTPKDPDPAPDNTDAIEGNTAAILAANEKLAEMVRQADSLVLSDNMAVTRTVAASGTAQVAAAANNYHREGDTNITQNIYSKAQTAADLQREARWEADRAKATKR